MKKIKEKERRVREGEEEQSGKVSTNVELKTKWWKIYKKGVLKRFVSINKKKH